MLWRLDPDREALPDVLRTVIEGKRMLALQLDQVGRIHHRIPVQQIVMCPRAFHPLILLDCPIALSRFLVSKHQRRNAQELTEVQEFAEAEKSNFAKVFLLRDRATLQTSVATSSRKGLCFFTLIYQWRNKTVTLVVFVPAFGFHFRVPAGHCTEIPFIATITDFFCDIVDLFC